VALDFINYLIKPNNSDTFSKFIANLAETINGQPATIVLDNLSVHRSKKVGGILQNYPNIKFLFLSPYSCKLNPIENLWSVIKQKWRLNTSKIEEQNARKPDKIISVLQGIIDSIPS